MEENEYHEALKSMEQIEVDKIYNRCVIDLYDCLKELVDRIKKFGWDYCQDEYEDLVITVCQYIDENEKAEKLYLFIEMKEAIQEYTELLEYKHEIEDYLESTLEELEP